MLKIGIEKNDTYLNIAVIVSALYGLLLVSSAVRSSGSWSNIIVQTVAILIGLGAMFVLSRIDYAYFTELNKVIMAGYILLLILVLIIGIGKEDTGTTGWISLGPVNIQPSEFAKLGYIITFATHLSNVQRKIHKFSTLMGLCLHAAVPLGLVLLQPDYGTAMVFAFITIFMMFFGGVRIRCFVMGFAAFLAMIPVLWFFVLDQFQKNRIYVFLDPQSSPMGAGYNVIQSKLAVGSGMIFGKGLFKGTQIQLDYLPGKHTDFIFAVAGEEFGFIGCLVIIALSAVIISRLFIGAERVKKDSGAFILIGIAAMFLFQNFENIGMCIGLMPVTGIPLPFFSYGGSSMITSFASIGVAQSILKRKNYI